MRNERVREKVRKRGGGRREGKGRRIEFWANR